MSYTSYDFTRRDSRTDVYRDDRCTYWTDRRTDYRTDRRTDSRTYYNYNYYQRYEYARDERRSRDRSSRDRYSSRRSSSSRSRESRGHSRGEGGSSRPDDRRPRATSSHYQVEHPEVQESIFYPDLWSTHMTDADFAQMAAWEDEARQAVQTEIRSTTQSVNNKATVSPVSPPNSRKRRHDAASFTSNYTTDTQPLPKRPKIHVNRHFYHTYGYHY